MSEEFFKPEYFPDGSHWVGPRAMADFCNRLLRGQSMTGWICKDANEVMTMHMANPEDATHTFQYFSIQPIEVTDTAESLLRELADEVYSFRGNGKLSILVDRARKLLSKGER